MPISAQLNVTPDGFCNHDDVVADAEFMEFASDLIADSDVLVLGRKTFELFEPYWPKAARDTSLSAEEQRLGQAIDGAERILVSRSVKRVDWDGTRILDELSPESARTISGSGKALILGSPSIISQVAQWGLLDRIHLTVHPVLGASGVRLSSARHGEADLQFAGETTLRSGVRDYEFARP